MSLTEKSRKPASLKNDLLTSSNLTQKCSKFNYYSTAKHFRLKITNLPLTRSHRLWTFVNFNFFPLLSYTLLHSISKCFVHLFVMRSKLVSLWLLIVKICVFIMRMRAPLVYSTIIENTVRFKVACRRLSHNVMKEIPVTQQQCSIITWQYMCISPHIWLKSILMAWLRTDIYTALDVEKL